MLFQWWTPELLEFFIFIFYYLDFLLLIEFSFSQLPDLFYLFQCLLNYYSMKWRVRGNISCRQASINRNFTRLTHTKTQALSFIIIITTLGGYSVLPLSTVLSYEVSVCALALKTPDNLVCTFLFDTRMCSMFTSGTQLWVMLHPPTQLFRKRWLKGRVGLAVQLPRGH